MPTARKTKSGKWRCQAFDYVEIVDGKKKYHHRSFTARTKWEAEGLANAFLRNKKLPSSELTLLEAIEKYIEIKKNVLSPATIRSYNSLKRNAFGHLLAVRIDKIFSEDVQECINQYALKHSAKSCKNVKALLTAVLGLFLPDRAIHASLPQIVAKDYYTPSDDDIKRLIAAIKYDELMKAVLLAAFGTLRRSEICGLQYDDINGTTIWVHRGMVRSDSGWITKDYPKNNSSNRHIVFPQFVIDALGTGEGQVVKMNPRKVDLSFRRAVVRAGLPYFRLHDLRAYAVSIAHALQIPDAYNMQRGGWANASTYTKIYRRVIGDENKEMTDKLIEHFEKLHS